MFHWCTMDKNHNNCEHIMSVIYCTLTAKVITRRLEYLITCPGLKNETFNVVSKVSYCLADSWCYQMIFRLKSSAFFKCLYSCLLFLAQRTKSTENDENENHLRSLWYSNTRPSIPLRCPPLGVWVISLCTQKRRGGVVVGCYVFTHSFAAKVLTIDAQTFISADTSFKWTQKSWAPF